VSPAAAPRADVREARPYDSPQLDVPVRLNTNECPQPMPSSFFDELAEAVRALPLHRYPDGPMTVLREALAARHGHTSEGTWVANGSNEILIQLLQAYGGPGRTAVVFEPTYLLHRRLSWLTHTDLVSFDVGAPYRLDRPQVDAAIAAHSDVIFVCSPNNPTGNAQPVDVVAELASSTTALVVVDEAYIEFGGDSALKLVADCPNVAVVRTFSKAFAMAGVRLGYVLTHPDVAQNLERVRLPYHLSMLTQTAGLVALRHQDEAMAMLDGIRAQRDRIVDELTGMDGIMVFASDANFVLFVPSAPAGEVWRRLLDRGVLIRDVSAVVPNALRVTAGTPDETSRFLAALREVLGLI
jgi:histidinol-phosphate aminotransferase